MKPDDFSSRITMLARGAGEIICVASHAYLGKDLRVFADPNLLHCGQRIGAKRYDLPPHGDTRPDRPGKVAAAPETDRCWELTHPYHRHCGSANVVRPGIESAA